MLQLKRLTKLPFPRLLSTSNSVLKLEHLKNRTLLRVAGPDVLNFLQGLITNDVNHLKLGRNNMYAMFLNTQGRIIYDSIIYKTANDDSLLIECDSEVSQSLEKHLKMFRVRRKIDIALLKDELKVHVLFNANKFNDQSSDQKILDGVLSQSSNNVSNDLVIYKDPRISQLGYRIIANADLNVSEHLSKIVTLEQNSDTKQNYRWLRFSLGVGEGIIDLPSGNCFPLECNCDYLHGVSFHKGCYIGQELTARIHHTGVIRKRLMPVHFNKIPSKAPAESIVQGKNNLGKFRGIEGDAGLGLLRIDKVLALKEIAIGDGIATTCKPNWWPIEVSKEKITKDY